MDCFFLTHTVHVQTRKSERNGSKESTRPITYETKLSFYGFIAVRCDDGGEKARQGLMHDRPLIVYKQDIYSSTGRDDIGLEAATTRIMREGDNP